MSEPLIELRHIFKIYQMGDEEVRASNDVSLSIDRGEFVAIVGKSGSGKSTLMNIIGALDSRTSREVLDFLKKLNEEGNTIVMITHDSSIALEAKRVVRVHDGQINFDGDVKEYAAIL